MILERRNLFLKMLSAVGFVGCEGFLGDWDFPWRLFAALMG